MHALAMASPPGFIPHPPWGLAHAELGEYAAAVGAMRTYLHRTPAADPYRAKASEALATWDAEMRKAQAAAAASPPPAISSSSASGN